jgi:tRNA G18 (ribose-2'-O)-methylase SpoU
MIPILDNIRSAQNTGSIIRTCDALGIKEAAFCGITPDPTDPKVKKTALGAESDINFKYFKTSSDAINYYRELGCLVLALETSGTDIKKYPKKSDALTCLIIGNEVSGISEQILKKSDQVLSIPMKGHKESLNVAVSFGIAAYILTEEQL